MSLQQCHTFPCQTRRFTAIRVSIRPTTFGCKGAQYMKILAALFLIFALTIRSGPLCATPVATPQQPASIAMADMAMTDCGHAQGSSNKNHTQKGMDSASACQPCVFPPVAGVALAAASHQTKSSPTIRPIAQLAGSGMAPPIPPPRSLPSTQYFNI